MFGFSKLDVMFGRTDADAVRLPYRELREARRAVSAGDDHRDRSRGAARDDRRGRLRGRPPGRRARRRLRLRGDAGPRRRQRVLLGGRCGAAARDPADASREGRVLDRRVRRAVQVPAGAERVRAHAARLCSTRAACGKRARSALSSRSPRPVPPSPETSKRSSRRSPSAASLSCRQRASRSVDAARSVATLDDGTEMPFDLFLGVPKHRVPHVVVDSGMAEDGLDAR